MELLLKLIPLLVVILLLSKKQHMLFAGFVGGVIAMVIGQISIETGSELFLNSISRMLAIIVPIMYAATASMVSQAGSIQAVVELSKRSLKGRVEILAGIIVLIQGLATYMSGMGAGNTMVIAPLAMSAVGLVPEVLGAMAVITTVGYTTSPASMESILVSEAAGGVAAGHAKVMSPFTLLFFGLAIITAIVGVKRRGIGENVVTEESEESTGELFRKSVPFVLLLVMVIFGNTFNNLVNRVIFTPATIVIFTTILTRIFSGFDTKETCNALVSGSTFILTTLFSVGMFLGFIELIASLGTFEEIAGMLSYIPENFVLPAAILLAFLIAIPSGAYTAGVFSLILPTLATLGLPGKAMGLVAIATGLGAQISPVQINVAALADGFEISIEEVIRRNIKFVVPALVILIGISFVII